MTAPAAPANLSASKIPIRKQARTGTTPPLEGSEDGDLKLITPPPTLPCTAKAFSLAGTVLVLTRQVIPLMSLQEVENWVVLTLGATRRPKHASMQQDQQNDDDSNSSCSSSNSHGSFPHQHQRRGRQLRSSSSASSHGDNDINTPPSPTLFSHRPQFNARKASARCRAIEGYVSFASVEGFGEPPADPLLLNDED